MNRMFVAVLVMSFVVAGAYAQQSSTASDSGSAPAVGSVSTVRGCLTGERGNYIVTEDKTGMVYVLKGVGNKLDDFLHKQVEVKGKLLPGRVKTGVRPEKSGSNPADTVHGVDGVPLQVANVPADITTIAKHCQAADQE